MTHQTPNSPEHTTKNVPLPAPDFTLPVRGSHFERAQPEIIRQLYAISSATACATLHRLGIRYTFIKGPVSRQPNAKIVGSAVTLQFMPQREDLASGVNQEYSEKTSALWAVLEEIQPNDILVVQAFADPYTGCFGEMLVNYLKNQGGAGLVVDGYIRDWPRVQKLEVPIWACGLTPHYASQAGLYPFGYNTPITCGNVLVLPGDIIIADDDGAVLVPRKLAPLLLEQTLKHEEWEVFSRLKLAEGGALAKYYPLNEEGQREYEEWRKTQGK
jgi:regulator of RNase E activity RraA